MNRVFAIMIALSAYCSATSVRHFIVFCTNVRDTTNHYGIVGNYILYNNTAINMDGRSTQTIPYAIIKDDCKDSGSIDAKHLMYILKNAKTLEKPLYNCDIDDYAGESDIDIEYLPKCD